MKLVMSNLTTSKFFELRSPNFGISGIRVRVRGPVEIGQHCSFGSEQKLNINLSPEDMVSHMNRENTSTRQNLRLSNIDLAAAKQAAEIAAKLGGVQLEDQVFKQKQ